MLTFPWGRLCPIDALVFIPAIAYVLRYVAPVDTSADGAFALSNVPVRLLCVIGMAVLFRKLVEHALRLAGRTPTIVPQEPVSGTELFTAFIAAAVTAWLYSIAATETGELLQATLFAYLGTATLIVPVRRLRNGAPHP